MRRREFIVVIGGAAVLPLVAPAQSTVPVIGFLNNSTQKSQAHFAAAFRDGMKESGFIEGRNVLVEYRWAEGHYNELPDLAADLVRHGVVLIAATGGTISVDAAKNATKDIPIVFVMGADPVKAGIVQSLNRPGANVTGVTMFSVSLTAKRIQLIRRIVPNSTTVTILVNPNNPDAQAQAENAKQAADAIGERIQIVSASTGEEIDRAIAELSHQPASCLVVANDAFFTSKAQQMAASAAKYHVPAVYPFREFAAAGGLASYATKLVDAYREAGSYAARILKGANPADLPVLQPTKLELVINQKAANELGLKVPTDLLALADEVME